MGSVDTFEVKQEPNNPEDRLRELCGENCEPSLEQRRQLQQIDLVMISGQFVGAGKSRLLNGLHESGRSNIPSYVNRPLRPGEKEGVDKCSRDTHDMLEMARGGAFLEMEEVRPGHFYATSLMGADPEQAYVKDAELQGALQLRERFDPELPIAIPLPPFTFDRKAGVTEWERRAIGRDFYTARNFDTYHADLYERLRGAAEECDRIIDNGLIDEKNTFIFINEDVDRSREVLQRFLKTRKKPNSSGLLQYIGVLRNIAQEALEAYDGQDSIVKGSTKNSTFTKT